MNLTVGPLPPAVYWRRRAVVLGVVLAVVLILVAMCGNPGHPKKTSQGTSGTATPSATSSVLTPVIETSGSTGPSASASPSTSTPSTDVPAGPPPSACLDSEMSLTVTATVRATDVVLQMKIKNISNRACSRDVGGTQQEIHVATATSQPNDPVVWSSDFCQAPNPPPDVRTFGPGIESNLPFGGVLWKKEYMAAGCTVVKPAPTGSYAVAAKIGTLTSPVVHITI